VEDIKASVPQYSICICNYNMGDTLEKSLTSVLDQIDDRFEVIFVDDGSSDSSLIIAESLAKKYTTLRVISLLRENGRKLGITRNKSIELASGVWCIFHIDCDDEIGPHLQEFVALVEELAPLMPRDVLFSGQQIHMAKRSFLLAHGPFRNIYRGEDRDLYMRLVKNAEWIVISHKRFIKRLQRARVRLLKKNLKDNLDQLATDLAQKISTIAYLKLSISNSSTLSFQIILFRILMLPFAKVLSNKRIDLNQDDYPSHAEFVHYRSQNTKSFDEWFEFFGKKHPSKYNHGSITEI